MRKILAALVGVALLGTQAASAITLIADTGYNFAGVVPDPGSFGSINQVKAVDFILAQSATNVSIAAAVGTVPGYLPGLVSAYLLPALGSAAPPIVQTSVTPGAFVDGSAPLTTLFFGLSLPAGHYYLVLYDTSASDFWQVASAASAGNGTTQSQLVWTASVASSPVWVTAMTSTNTQPLNPAEGVGYGFSVAGTPGTIPPAPTTYPAPAQVCGTNPQESQLYILRQQVGANDAQVSAGDIIQAGSYCVIDTALGLCATAGASADISGSIALAGNSYTLVSANDGTNPNHWLHYIPVSDFAAVANGTSPAGPAQISATISGTTSSASCDTPPLTDSYGVIAPVVPYAGSLSFSTPNGVLTPTISFVEPNSFLTAAKNASGGGSLRLQIWDLQPAAPSAPFIIYAANSGFTPSFSTANANYSFNVPATLTTNGVTYSLALNHPYAIEIQSALLRQSGTGFGTGNANVIARSRVFSDFTPIALPSGVNSVSIPTVNPTGSGNGSPQYSFTTAVTADTTIYVETPAPISSSLVFSVGGSDPNFASVQVPVSSAFDGATVYVSTGGTFVSVGILSNGTAVMFPPGGVSSFELVLPGGAPAAKAAAQKARTNAGGTGSGGPALIGLGFTASGSFTGTATPGATAAASVPGPATDGPVPLWSLGVLVAGLVGIARRRMLPR